MHIPHCRGSFVLIILSFYGKKELFAVSEISVLLFLQARQYKDFIALLPEHVALKILSYLTVKELLRSCMVSFSSFKDTWLSYSQRVT